MTAKTKKTLIIVAAVLAIAAIVYYAVRGSKHTAKGMINRLNASAAIKKAIISHLEQAKAEQDINANAAANGCSYEQALALTAAYYLVNDGTVDDATWQNWKAEILTM